MPVTMACSAAASCSSCKPVMSTTASPASPIRRVKLAPSGTGASKPICSAAARLASVSTK